VPRSAPRGFCAVDTEGSKRTDVKIDRGNTAKTKRLPKNRRFFFEKGVLMGTDRLPEGKHYYHRS